MKSHVTALLTIFISFSYTTGLRAQADIRFPVAVFPFRKEGRISKGEMERITEALRTQFLESGRYEVASYETFKDLMRERRLPYWEAVPDSLVEDIAHSLGVKLIVEGLVKRQDDGGLSVSAHLLDITTKKEKIVKEVSIPPEAKVEMLASALINNIFLQIDCDKFAAFGRQYLKNKNYERAEENFLRVIELDSTHVDCHYYLGNTYLEMGDTTRAVEQYHTALKFDPGYSDAYARLATVYQHRKDVENASKAFSRLIELDPDNLSYRLNYASVLFQNEMYQEAMRQYGEALKLDSTSVNVWMGIGLSHYTMGDWKEAIGPLEKASELNPSDVNTLIYLVSAYHKLNDYSGAASGYERIVAINPSYPKAYLNLGLFYQKLKKNDKAIEAFKQGTVHSPEEDRGELYLALANALNKAKRFREAIDAAKKAVEKGANVRKCYMIIGDAYQDMGESLESADTIENYREAIAYYEKSSEAYENVLQDPKFGKYAKDNIERNKELIKRAELIIKKKELGG
ncbi:MAG: tetratricopeptide repeat protein [Candidatus Glassbacteria bacterium]